MDDDAYDITDPKHTDWLHNLEDRLEVCADE